ncbi:3-galactosyl-N-acetylglucosaminide 4-alpha-L-fucosyltransferase FUT3-like [Ornithodoros turicata]|uniref:3-galactosyl-N-acetylglucosaminide 4-alpha-L-fucosyltransferase FUT3-like n=1 Tax=Ornithodoros turicata TaxID=34597 RepID=UPI0031394BFE
MRLPCSSLRFRYFKYTCHLGLVFLMTVVFVFMAKQWTLPQRGPPTKQPFSVTSSERQNHSKRDSEFKILIWNVGKRMQRRFLRSFSATEKDPFKYCTVRNCKLEVDNDKIGEASAVMFHLHLTKGPHTLPPYHKPDQDWIFFTDESPLHTFLLTKKYRMRDYNGIFNLSMTYRSDSDIPVPYGRTVRLSPEEKGAVGQLRNFAAQKARLVAILGSNCGGTNRRWDYVHELEKYIQVDIYGGCGNKAVCPGHFTRDCDVMKEYKFYLSFENSNCREYITEKLWWNAYEKEVVPVVMGGSKSDYEKLCPPKSFIHVEDFESPRDLAAYLKALDADDVAYNAFFQWKKEYRVLNEHGYFGSPSLHLCRICEKLNAPNRLPKVYSELDSFWNAKEDCRKPAW